MQEVEEEISELEEEVSIVQKEIFMIIEVISHMVGHSFSQVNNIVVEVKGYSTDHQLVRGVVKEIIKVFNVFIVESMVI